MNSIPGSWIAVHDLTQLRPGQEHPGPCGDRLEAPWDTVRTRSVQQPRRRQSWGGGSGGGEKGLDSGLMLRFWTERVSWQMGGGCRRGRREDYSGLGHSPGCSDTVC